MTTLNAIVIIGSVAVIIINVLNVRYIRKLDKRRKEIEKQLSDIRRKYETQTEGKGNPWHIPPEPIPSQYPPSSTRL